MGNVDKDKIIEEFTKAYQKANGKAPTIEAKSGWYSVDGGKNMRIGQLEEMTATLNDQQPDTPVAKAPAKTESKPAAKKTKAAAKPKAKKQKGSFSVKAFWQEKLASENPGSRSPR